MGVSSAEIIINGMEIIDGTPRRVRLNAGSSPGWNSDVDLSDDRFASLSLSVVISFAVAAAAGGWGDAGAVYWRSGS
jgi:hypothetical protein